MNIITLCTKGKPGNAKTKRARRGMEKDWNRHGEPLKKFLKPDNFHKAGLQLKNKIKEADQAKLDKQDLALEQ